MFNHSDFERLSKFRKKEDLGPVKIRNEFELREMLKGYRPESTTMSAKLLKEGFEMLKRHHKYSIEARQASNDDGQSYRPAKIPDVSQQKTWVDRLIETQMGGSREGLEIVWELSGSRFTYNPLSHQLQKESQL